MFQMLNVGCGTQPIGDVNCDLFTNRSPHLTGVVSKGEYFVRCDASHLPFKDNSFQIVHCSHVLEHLLQPYDALKEFKRVAKHVVYLRVPSSTTVFRQHDLHLYAWDLNTFSHLLSTVFSNFQIHSGSCTVLHGRLTNRLWLLKRALTLIVKKLFLDELTAICKKDGEKA